MPLLEPPDLNMGMVASQRLVSAHLKVASCDLVGYAQVLNLRAIIASTNVSGMSSLSPWEGTPCCCSLVFIVLWFSLAILINLLGRRERHLNEMAEWILLLILLGNARIWSTSEIHSTVCFIYQSLPKIRDRVCFDKAWTRPESGRH